MKYTHKIKQAIRMAIRVHELDQKQKRKGKDVPYIIHPLIVGLVLARIGADEDTVAAGILHDTIEDSVSSKKITKEKIEEIFGMRVAQMVYDVTEKDKSLPWIERKRAAIDEIKQMSKRSLLVKGSDVVSNCAELIADYRSKGDALFMHFGVSKEKQISHYAEVIQLILKRFPSHPLKKDLVATFEELTKISKER